MSLEFDVDRIEQAIPEKRMMKLLKKLVEGDEITVILNSNTKNYTVPVGKTGVLRIVMEIDG
jgi:hypothetical protein